MTALVVVLTFLKAHWKAVTLSAVTLATGVWVGRHSVTCPVPPPCPSCPQVHCAAAVESPKCSDSTKVVVRWRIRPSVTAGCPPQLTPDVTLAASGVASTGASTASSEAKPQVTHPDVPKVSPAPVTALQGARWTAYGGAAVTLQGQLGLLGGVTWDPYGLPIGFGILLDVRPKTPSESAVGLTVSGRW